VFGVELEFYEYEDWEILIPKLFGAEVKKTVGRTSKSGRKKWDGASFFEDAKERLSSEHLQAVEELYEWSQDAADQIDWGTGAQRGSFNPKFDYVHQRSVFSVYSDGEMSLHFDWLDDSAEGQAYADRLGRQLRLKLGVFGLPDDYMENHVSVPVETWGSHLEDFLKVLEGVLVEEVVSAHRTD